MKRYIVSSHKIMSQDEISLKDRLQMYFDQQLNQYEDYHWEIEFYSKDDEEWGMYLYLCKDSNDDAVYADYVPIGDEPYLAVDMAWQDRQDIADMENAYLDDQNFTEDDFAMMRTIPKKYEENISQLI